VFANKLDDDGRKAIYSSLEPTGEVYSSEPGKLSPRWQELLDRAKEKRDRETDPDLIQFYRWKVKQAEWHLRFQKELLEEEAVRPS
jgi:hypothetical protein